MPISPESKLSNKPIICDIGITRKCFFKCRMCRFWQSPPEDGELSCAEWKNFIRDLKDFCGDGVRLHFAGGEPLLKEGFLEILEFSHSLGLGTFIVTNGFLIDDARAAGLVRSGVEGVTISLDSLDEGTHDFLRGVTGAHKMALQGIDNLYRHGANSVSILSVIMAHNLGGITELADWAETNPAVSSIYFQAVAQPIATSKDPDWHLKEEFSDLWPQDASLLDSVFTDLIGRKNKGAKISNSARQLETFRSYFRHPYGLREGLICDQGDHVLCVTPGGEAMLCGLMESIGNVRRDGIGEIWNSSRAELRRKQIYACRENCLNVLNCFVDKELP